MKEAGDVAHCIQMARAAFPAGLEQPEGSFRFSRDALLLAEFAVEQMAPDSASVAELGAGCGVISLAILLQKEGWKAVGLEREQTLAEAAGRNAAMLGLGERYVVLTGDVRSSEALRSMRAVLSGTDKSQYTNPSSLPLFDLVVTNPPWRVEGAGRVPPSDMRRRALFGGPETFREFFSAADALLKNDGLLAMVSGAERAADILSSLPPRLRPEVMRFVFTKDDEPAEFVLLLARKNGRRTLRVERA